MQSGVFQGSPLSPLLFGLAVKPMSAHTRQLAAQQSLHGLRLPDRQPSPFLHLHADDPTVHAGSLDEAEAILDGSIALHIDATGARLQRSKSSGMGIGSLQHLVCPDPATGITFSVAGTTARHLGIPLSTDTTSAAEALYTDILQRLQTRIGHWSGSRLSLLGRAHVAKQVLVAMFNISWHLHTGAREAPQTALHISIHLRGSQQACGGRGSTSVPQQRCLQQST